MKERVETVDILAFPGKGKKLFIRKGIEFNVLGLKFDGNFPLAERRGGNGRDGSGLPGPRAPCRMVRENKRRA